ncbi:MAG: hypothetical protein FWF77_01430, partial [Defluviitaleaceae bacterium]|nr:hypothetical protein [Defluviitaleaceae bacterium]
MTVLPEIFKERMQKLLGENAEQFFASYNNPPVRGMNYKIDDVSDTKELPDNNIFIWTQDFCRSARSENRRDLEGRK